LEAQIYRAAMAIMRNQCDSPFPGRTGMSEPRAEHNNCRMRDAGLSKEKRDEGFLQPCAVAISIEGIGATVPIDEEIEARVRLQVRPAGEGLCRTLTVAVVRCTWRIVRHQPSNIRDSRNVG